jgi:hypothetical protein
MPPASSPPAGTPAARPPDSGRRLYRLCLEVAAFWWALSTTSFVSIMAGLGLALLARRVTQVDLLLPMGMSFGARELANDQGAAAVLVASFVIGFLLTALSLWKGTAPFLVGKAPGGRAGNNPPDRA